ncbi:MAG: hypothetical protein ABFD25_02070 [Clostridiaceae bacterium]
MKCLQCISPVGLTLLAVAAGFSAIAALDYDELNVLGNWLIGVGGLMIIAASQGDYLEGLEAAKSREDILRKQIELLRNEVESISVKSMR